VGVRERRFSAPFEIFRGYHRPFYTLVAGTFQELKFPGFAVDHHPPFPTSVEIKERVELYLYSSF
jgi:hypothetical protein